MSDVVKQCPKCSAPLTLDALVRGEQVEAIGILHVGGAPHLTSYYFNHTRPGCHTTFVVPVRRFAGLVDEPIVEEDACGAPGCAGQCGRIDDLAGCDVPCANASFRRFFLTVLRKPRDAR